MRRYRRRTLPWCRPAAPTCPSRRVQCLLLLLFLLFIICQLPDPARAGTVRLPSGRDVRGAVEPGCLKYLGIPFAAPPIGARRWRPPAPVHSNNTKEIDATVYRPLCMQPGHAWSTLGRSISEDCLYLNVFTPNVYDPQSLPVLVYIHGGDYLYGGANDSQLDGCDLVRVTGEALVVTLQYRLGVFGFLGSDALRGRDTARGTTGNYGLLDMIAALEWVRDNVGVFGGNNNKVMIFGESAGAGGVNNLLVSPLARGLFHRAVMQSGAFALWTAKQLPDATAIFDELVATADGGACAAAASYDGDNGSIACLQALPADKLLVAAEALHAYPDRWTVCRWAPTVDGVALLTHPSDAVATPSLAAAAVADVPIVYGNNDEEGASFVSETRLSSSAALPRDLTVKDLSVWVDTNFDAHAGRVAAAVKDAYGIRKTAAAGDSENTRLEDTPWFTAQRIVGDLMLFCPGRRAARTLMQLVAVRERLSPVFEYMFDFAADRGVSYHGAEVPFVFADVNMASGATPEEAALAHAMAWLWTSFARDGVPTPASSSAVRPWREPLPAPVVNLTRHCDGGRCPAGPAGTPTMAWQPWPAFLEMDTRANGGLAAKRELRAAVCDELWDPLAAGSLGPKAGGADIPVEDGSGGQTGAIVLGFVLSGMGLSAFGAVAARVACPEKLPACFRVSNGARSTSRYAGFVDEDGGAGSASSVELQDMSGTVPPS